MKMISQPIITHLRWCSTNAARRPNQLLGSTVAASLIDAPLTNLGEPCTTENLSEPEWFFKCIICHMAGETVPGKGRTDLPEVIGTGFLLSALGAHSSMNFARRLAALDLTPPHVGVLRGIGLAPGRSQQAVADEFGIPPSRLVTFIDELEHAGLVERRRDERDRRVQRLFLTPKGAKTMEEIADIGRESEQALLQALSSDERLQLHQLLERLMANHDITVHPGYRAMRADTDGPPRD
jgi:DNA-binding MarR family transcriptional regulator